MAKTGSKSGLVKLSQRNAERLSRLLGNNGGVPGSGNPFRDSSFSRVRLAKAPVGGIPARVTTTLGSVTNCNPIVVDPDTGVITVDTSREFQCYNLSESVVGDTGDRYIMVTNHSNGAFAIVGGGGATECDPLWDTLTIAELETGDVIPFVRDGCLQGAEIRECDTANAAREAAFEDF
jgi:hypothetical protein